MDRPVSGHVRRITAGSGAELRRELDAAAAEARVRALVLGFRDEEDFPAGPGEDPATLIGGLPKPLILTIGERARGPVFGAVLAAHVCIAARAALFGPADPSELVLHIGARKTAALARTDGVFDARTALELGLVNRTVEPGELVPTALGIAERIAEMSPRAVRTCLRAVEEGLRLELGEGLRRETELFTRIFAAGDFREGTSAFFEKRKPEWKV